MRLGLFGGAFDPIHNAHLFVAEAVRESEGLERVVFLPTRAGRHRAAPLASVEDRAAMIRLAIAANPAFALDLTDAQEDATGYTADLLPRLRARYPEDDFFFIAGADSLTRSPWQRLDHVLEALSAFLLVPRNDVSPSDVDNALAQLQPVARAKIRVLDLPRIGSSATTLRERLESGRSIRYLTPDSVWRYVAERGLYR